MCRLFRQYIPFFKVYTMYVRQYERGMALIQDLIAKRPLLKNFIALNEACEGMLLQRCVRDCRCRRCCVTELVFLAAF